MSKTDTHKNPTVPHLVAAEDDLPDEHFNRQSEVDAGIQDLLNALIPPQYALPPDAAKGVQIASNIAVLAEAREYLGNLIYRELGISKFAENEEDRQARREQFDLNFFPFLK